MTKIICTSVHEVKTAPIGFPFHVLFVIKFNNEPKKEL